MKRSELKQIIKEEVRKTLNEGLFDSTSKPSIKDLKEYEIEIKFNPTYIGFAWKVNGKEEYQETSYHDIKNFNDLLTKIFSEIDYISKNSTINEEFDNRKNKFSSIFLQTFYDMNDNEITFDEASDRLFAWIKSNFK